MKLQTLKPRVPMLSSALARAVIERKRGRAGVADRDRIRHRDKGLCQACLKRNLVTPGTQVDHVIPLHKGGPDTEANKQLLCDPCHAEKTLQDRQP